MKKIVDLEPLSMGEFAAFYIAEQLNEEQKRSFQEGEKGGLEYFYKPNPDEEGKFLVCCRGRDDESRLFCPALDMFVRMGKQEAVLVIGKREREA